MKVSDSRDSGPAPGSSSARASGSLLKSIKLASLGLLPGSQTERCSFSKRSAMSVPTTVFRNKVWQWDSCFRQVCQVTFLLWQIPSSVHIDLPHSVYRVAWWIPKAGAQSPCPTGCCHENTPALCSGRTLSRPLYESPPWWTGHKKCNGLATSIVCVAKAQEKKLDVLDLFISFTCLVGINGLRAET